MFVPFMSAQWISARSPTLNAATFAARAGGTAHVSPATVMDIDETAETVLRAALFSVGGRFGTHLVGPSSTAEPQAVPPPSLPLAKPPAVEKPAERFASKPT
jgi:hypothetical protein